MAVGVVAKSGQGMGCGDVFGHAVVDLHQDRPLVVLYTPDDPSISTVASPG